MPENDLLYRLALSCVPGIGPVYAKRLINHFGDAAAIFHAPSSVLAGIDGLGTLRANAITCFDQFSTLEEELAFLEKYAIRCLFFTDKDYPQRLRGCKDAPILLFYKGTADLNASRIVSIVGTRTPTEYGKQAIERLMSELAICGPLVISGLAFGIDAAAHKAAMKHSLSTVGVLGHGFGRVYPSEHRSLAAEMIKQGGLLTNFHANTKPSSYNFPLRNRLVAGICDGLVVVETDTDGGSMLTVNNAHSYDKKVFAFPGRLTDKKSRGCNQLIHQGSARLLLNGSQILAELGWGPSDKPSAKQAALFPSGMKQDLPENERTVLRLLEGNRPLTIDEVTAQTRLNSSTVALTLINLELHGFILSLPGKRYRLAI